MEAVKAQDRLAVLKKIEEYERQGLFNLDVEDDPPFKPLKASKIDFLDKKLFSKIKTFWANFFADRFFTGLMKQKKVIFKGVLGLENLKGFNGGAIVTCNHCNMFDNYAVLTGLRQQYKKMRLYRVIREGNYALPGKIGFFMRNCDTLPIGSPKLTEGCFSAIKTLLDKNKLILVFPEQSMWWNYKKPRPLHRGAFHLAAKNNVPVIPCFLTLSDSDIIGADGFAVQEFTMHIFPLIYPDKALSLSQNAENIKNQNFALWKTAYEQAYGKELKYGDK